MLDATVADFRCAARALARNAGFTSTAVLTMALGIGVATAIFSVVCGVMLRPLPFPDADRLVQVVQLLPRPGQAEPSRAGLTPQQIADWRASRTLAEVGYSGVVAGSRGVVALFLIVGGVAAHTPVRRAARIDPALALRTE
jgi:hypothetical protein